MVTGGRGFVGAWLAKALLERGREVVSLERPASRQRTTLSLLGMEDRGAGDRARNWPTASRWRAGCASIESWRSSTSAPRPIVGTVAESPLPAFETNVRGTWTLLDACLAAGVERVVVASSDKAYGAHDELPYREDFALQPTAPTRPRRRRRT